jgi:hypothetical protein
MNWEEPLFSAIEVLSVGMMAFVAGVLMASSDNMEDDDDGR